MAQTEIILKKDIMGLGDEGDIKKVAPGYARNYLLPFGFAVLKTADNLKKLESEQEEINKRKAEKLDASKSVVEKVNDLVLDYEVNAVQGKLFGSIGTNEIYQSIKDKGIDIDKNQIILAKPFKNTGEFEVELKFYGELRAKVKVNIINQNEEDEVIEDTASEEVETPQTEASVSESTAESTENTEAVAEETTETK